MLQERPREQEATGGVRPGKGARAAGDARGNKSIRAAKKVRVAKEGEAVKDIKGLKLVEGVCAVGEAERAEALGAETGKDAEAEKVQRRAPA